MSQDPSQPISRRTFLGLLGGVAGLGAVSWSLTRSGPGPTAATAGGMTTLPPVSTTTAAPAPIAAAQAAVASTLPPPPRTVSVLCRDAWGARPIIGQLTPHTLSRLTVHHTAAVLSSDAAAPTYVRDHQASHQLGNGWPDLAYHFIIDAAGMIYEGRPLTAVGDTGTDYDPTGHLLVACEGNFDRQDVPVAQYEALVDVLAWAGETYGIAPDTIAGHKDWAATACPGAALYASVADGSLVAAVRSRIDGGGVGFDLRCGPGAEAVVAAIEAGAGDTVSAIPWDDRGVE